MTLNGAEGPTCRFIGSAPQSPGDQLVPKSCRALAILCVPLAGCTPLGAWIYDAPRFTVSEIHATAPQDGRLALEFVMTGCNLNDYDLMADSLALQLTFLGQPVSSATYDKPIALPMRDSARVSVAVSVPGERVRDLRGGGERDVPFALHTVSTMQTPMGVKVVDLWHRGTVRLRADTAVGWAGAMQNACRPGTSVLPPAEGRGKPLPNVRGPEVAPDTRRLPNQQQGSP